MMLGIKDYVSSNITCLNLVATDSMIIAKSSVYLQNTFLVLKRIIREESITKVIIISPFTNLNKTH